MRVQSNVCTLVFQPSLGIFSGDAFATDADRKSKGKFWIHRLSFWPPEIDKLDDLTRLNLGKFSCIQFYHIFTPISVDSTHWIIFYIPHFVFLSS